MDKAEKIIYDRFIVPTKNKNYEYIGMEFECPIFIKDSQISIRKLGSEFLSYLVEKKDFIEESRGYDGCLVKVNYVGDKVSFDAHYSVIEFSIKPCRTLIEIKERYNKYLSFAQEYYTKNGCEIMGFGNYYPYKAEGELDNMYPKCLVPEFTNDDLYVMVKEHFEKAVGYGEGMKYLINMCSTQTHLDVPFDEYIDTFNLLNELTFVRGTLFSNSPWLSEEGMYYCSRDNAWKASKEFNTGIFDKHFESIEDFCHELSKENALYSINDEGKPVIIEAVPLKKYFNEMGKDPKEIDYFRCFKNVVPNSYCCIEIREDCTQPFSDDLVTGAFNLGVSIGHKDAANCLKSFKKRAKIENIPNSVLRKQSITGKLDIEKDLLREFFRELYNIAHSVLKNRGFGEEALLFPLKSRIESLKCPAQIYLENKGR